MDEPYSKLLEKVFQIAKELASRGPGWAQQNTVLSEVAKQVPGARIDQNVQQRILTCWHDLFRLGRLSWGHNIDNPDAPFYHVPNPESHRDVWSVQGELARASGS